MKILIGIQQLIYNLNVTYFKRLIYSYVCKENLHFDIQKENKMSKSTCLRQILQRNTPKGRITTLATDKGP